MKYIKLGRRLLTNKEAMDLLNVDATKLQKHLEAGYVYSQRIQYVDVDSRDIDINRSFENSCVVRYHEKPNVTTVSNMYNILVYTFGGIVDKKYIINFLNKQNGSIIK